MNRNCISTGYLKPIVSKLFLLTVTLVLLVGCKEEKTPKVIVAKVADNTLTEEGLDSLLSFTSNKNKYTDEVIRDWVLTELIYNEAKESDILETREYMDLVEESKKKLANAILLSNMIQEQEVETNDALLSDYYLQNHDEMKLSGDAFVFNRVVFNDENKAIHFRSILIESDWNKSINVFSGDESLVSWVNKKFLYTYDFALPLILEVLANLEENETSIIFESEPGLFNVVQLVKSYQENDVPDFEYVKNLVKTRYYAAQQSKIYEAYVQKLYSKYDVLINR